MIKIFTDRQCLTPENRTKVFPLLFDLVYLPNDKAMSYFGFTDSIIEANVAIFPIDIISFTKKGKDNFLNKWINMISEHDIPIWVYASGDFGLSLKIPNVTTFRFGGLNSKLHASTSILPAFIADPYDKILKNNFFLLEKTENPSLGFVGNANGAVFQVCKEFVLYIERNLINLTVDNPQDYQPFYPSSRKRYLVLRRILKDHRIQSNFIFRNKYRARDKNVGTKEATTLDFFKNIQDNLYVFCLRGNGNFSIRFYEALIMGRIPVLVDTDIRLPLSDQIDWSKHCVIVPEDVITDNLILFHSSKTDLELKEMQIANRKLMLEKLNRIDYFIEFANSILKDK